ncbi:YlbE-like family protein [Virgibacillus sp. DJP39]|uniref:YlbE-like family protein n=1 Tax=Virgibacillus sp. DJP39 TaxID=3409790 RepID=UPI003BB7C25D
MDINCYHFLKSDQTLLKFVRYNPIWYRYLTRDPSRIDEVEKEAKKFYNKTFPQQVERANSQLSMMKMLIEFANMDD